MAAEPPTKSRKITEVSSVRHTHSDADARNAVYISSSSSASSETELTHNGPIISQDIEPVEISSEEYDSEESTDDAGIAEFVSGAAENGGSGAANPILSDIYEARAFLRVEGSMRFLDRYLPATATVEDIVRLTMLLGFRPSDLLEMEREQTLVDAIRCLQKAINRVLGKRKYVLEGPDLVAEALDRVKTSKKIIVLTGAGISTSLGIPDFRSSKGIYSKLQDLNLSDPQEVFDLHTFKEDPSIFYSIAYMVLPPDHSYTPLHAFIKLLHDKGKLLRNYTQNIDNLEQAAGIPRDKVIQCHGSFATASCRTCKRQVEGAVIFKEIRAKQLPICSVCAKQRKKLSDNDSLDLTPDYGVMKPDITFFGEGLPDKFHNNVMKDVLECDLLICIGTSLKVAPVNEIVKRVGDNVPQILINKDPVNHCDFDVSLLGYCDDVATYICNKIGWSLNHKNFKKIAESGLQCKLVDMERRLYEVISRSKNSEEVTETDSE